jgi:hypothetical protein
MLVHAQRRWLAVLSLAGPLFPFAYFTGHVTIASMAAGITAWACGELCNSQRFQTGGVAIDYQRGASVFRVALNLAGIALIVLALYRFCKFGFWPISGLI